MRDVNLAIEVARPLFQKMGMNTTDVLDDIARAYGVFINIAFRKLYDRFDWPDYATIEERTPVAHYIDFQQTPPLAIIHRVLKVYQRDPRLTIPQCDVPFRMYSNGIHVGYDHGTTVWLKYMPPPPIFTLDTWAATTTYTLGSRIYDAAAGNAYLSLQVGNTNHVPNTSPTWWQYQPFPESMADLTTRLAFAEALREDGQFDKANSEEQNAIQEAITKIAAMVNVALDPITDQSRPASRYRPAPSLLAGGGGK